MLFLICSMYCHIFNLAHRGGIFVSHITSCYSLQKWRIFVTFHDNPFTHSGKFLSWFHAYFRKYRLFTNGDVLKQPLYGPNPVELVENWKICKIFLRKDIGLKPLQILSKNVAKTLKCQKLSCLAIVLYCSQTIEK